MNCEQIIIYIVQFIVIHNAILEGWNVKKIGIRKYELSKDNVKGLNLRNFVRNLLKIRSY